MIKVIVIVLYIIFAVWQLWIYSIRRKNRKLIRGKIVDNVRHNENSNIRYVEIVEYKDSDGNIHTKRGPTTNGGRRNRIGKEVNLYEYYYRGKTRVRFSETMLYVLLIKLLLVGIIAYEVILNFS